MKKRSLKHRLGISAVYKATLFFFSFVLLVPLFFILFYIIKHGMSVLSLDFFLNLPKPVGESGGGVSNAIVGTLMLVGLAVLMSVPTGILLGVYLAENKHGRMSSWARLAIDVIQGVPSIVIGILAYIWVVVPLGSFSAFSGGFALALIMLPLVAKSTEETVKLVPNTVKEAAYALGAPYYKVILKVVIPSSMNGILSGVILGVARVCGETAPLLFTAFGNPFMNFNVAKSVNSLPLLIFNYSMSPYKDWQDLAWGASLILIVFVLGLSLIAKGIQNYGK